MTNDLTTQNEIRSQSLEDQKDEIVAQIETARLMRELSTHDKDVEYWNAEIDRLFELKDNLPSSETLWQQEHAEEDALGGQFVVSGGEVLELGLRAKDSDDTMPF